MQGIIFFVWSFAGAALAIFLAGFIALIGFRPLVKLLVERVVRRLLKDRYPENLWEMVTAFMRINPRIIVENSLRAETGGVIERPFGSPRKFLKFDGLVFSPAQLAVLPQPE